MVDLVEIQKLQFTNLPLAEKQLLEHLVATGFKDIQSVKIVPKPQSLNSISGFVKSESGEELFFKTHTEEQERLVEYYNSELLESVGYPVIKAKLAQQKPGSQFALYKKIELPTLFDQVHAEEVKGEYEPALLRAQSKLDKETFEIFNNTLMPLSEEDNTKQPIHQLFAHRLSTQGRISSFYSEGKIADFEIKELFSKRWQINGNVLPISISDAISRAREVLAPKAIKASVVGHGDAHNGNIFYKKGTEDLFYFDPAFCGRHSLSLDLVKPLFHNIFGRWMYLPKIVDGEFELSIKSTSSHICVEHNFKPSKLRKDFLNSKIEYLLAPLSDKLDRRLLQFGMFCCPLLTVNLTRTEPGRLESAYSDKIRILGLILAIQCANDRQPNDDIGSMLSSIYNYG